MRTLCTDGQLDLCTLLAGPLGVVVGGSRARCVSFNTHTVPWLPLLNPSSTSPLLMRDGPVYQKSYNTEILRRTHGTRMLRNPWQMLLSGSLAHYHPNRRSLKPLLYLAVGVG